MGQVTIRHSFTTLSGLVSFVSLNERTAIQMSAGGLKFAMRTPDPDEQGVIILQVTEHALRTDQSFKTVSVIHLPTTIVANKKFSIGASSS